MGAGSLFLVGFLLGMRHALEADHVAAIASLTGRGQSLGRALRQGGAWGLGHTLTLLLFGAVVLFMERVIPQSLAQALEAAVGLMLVLLGADLLRRLRRQRVHLHVHRHADGRRHLHLHSHAGDRDGHDPERHHHPHPQGFPLRALLVGLMHGMAGSAALILLTLETVADPASGLIYILLFGAGSILGMALLSLAISIPLRLSARYLSRAYTGLQLLIALFTIGLGLSLLYTNVVSLPA